MNNQLFNSSNISSWLVVFFVGLARGYTMEGFLLKMTTVDIETMTRQYKQMVALKGADVPNRNKSKGQEDNRTGWRL